MNDQLYSLTLNFENAATNLKQSFFSFICSSRQNARVKELLKSVQISKSHHKRTVFNSL